LTLSQPIEKLQHFEISFDGKNQRKIVIFEMILNRKFKFDYADTKAMVQSTFVPNLSSIKAFFL
jgi:hypothetical protein